MDWTQVYAIFGANLIMITISISLTTLLCLLTRNDMKKRAQENNIFHNQISDIIKEIREEKKNFNEKLLLIKSNKKEIKK